MVAGCIIVVEGDPASPAVRTDQPGDHNPYPIGAVGDRHLRVSVAEIAVEQSGFVLPAHTIIDAPLRVDPEGASAPLARFGADWPRGVRRLGVGFCP